MLIVRGITLNPEIRIGYLGSPDQVSLQQGYAGFESLHQPDWMEPIRLQTDNKDLLSQRTCKAGLACSLCAKFQNGSTCEDVSNPHRKAMGEDKQE